MWLVIVLTLLLAGIAGSILWNNNPKEEKEKGDFRVNTLLKIRWALIDEYFRESMYEDFGVSVGLCHFISSRKYDEFNELNRNMIDMIRYDLEEIAEDMPKYIGHESCYWFLQEDLNSRVEIIDKLINKYETNS